MAVVETNGEESALFKHMSFFTDNNKLIDEMFEDVKSSQQNQLKNLQCLSLQLMKALTLQIQLSLEY